MSTPKHEPEPHGSLARVIGARVWLVFLWVSTQEAAGVPTRPSCSLPKPVLAVERGFCFFHSVGVNSKRWLTRKLWVLPFFLQRFVIWMWFHNSQAHLVNTILNLKRQFGMVPGDVRWISQLKYSKRWAHFSSVRPFISSCFRHFGSQHPAFRFCLTKTGSDSYLCFSGKGLTLNSSCLHFTTVAPLCYFPIMLFDDVISVFM